MGIRVESGGFLTTVQDEGRYLGMASGFSTAGSMDQNAAMRANILVGNSKEAAVLEYAIIGPTLIFTSPNVIAFGGGLVTPKLNGSLIPNFVLAVERGDRLEIGQLRAGRYGYLAINGGVQVVPVLKSRSTSVLSHVGGFHGRRLESGDYLQTILPDCWPKPLPNHQDQWALTMKNSMQSAKQPVVIHITPGPQADWFSKETCATFVQNDYVVGQSSNRMGIRLKGDSIDTDELPEMLSEATVMGGIQVPRGGQPIILLADRQTTGGYPVIGVVVPKDLSMLVQLVPGQLLRFEWQSLRTSQQAEEASPWQMQPQISFTHRRVAAQIGRLFKAGE